LAGKHQNTGRSSTTQWKTALLSAHMAWNPKYTIFFG